MLHDRFLSGGPDGSDLEMLQSTARDAKFPDALPHGFDAIGAGENQPVVALDTFQSIVEGPVRLRLADLNEGNFGHRCTQAAQAYGKGGRPVAGAEMGRGHGRTP